MHSTVSYVWALSSPLEAIMCDHAYTRSRPDPCEENQLSDQMQGTSLFYIGCHGKRISLPMAVCSNTVFASHLMLLKRLRGSV